MSIPTFETSISILQQSPGSCNTTNALISIRNGVDWPKNKSNIVRLRESGCLKQITAILGCSKKTSIDLALSILGNCLMDNICSKEVLTQHNILSVLNQLFKKFPKEDSINGRAFRVIGNMCKHTLTWTKILMDKNPDIVSHLVEVVKKASMEETPEGVKISEATIITALRALRVLLNCHTKMTLLKDFGALKAIGALFIKYSTEWQNHKQHEKMLLHIINLIQECSRYKYYHSVIEMRNTERGDALLHLAAVLLLDPKRIVKIVMNFINSCQLQSELPVPEIFAKFVEVLENHSIIKEFNGDCIGYLHCLCYLLDHPANRHHERCGKAVPSLIKALKEFDKPTNVIVESCTLLIHTLNKFKYDEKLMSEQLKNGIIPILIDKLCWLVGQPDVVNVKHSNEKKRKYVFGPTSPVLGKKRFIRDDTMRECSPCSSNSSDDEMDILSTFRLTQRSPTSGNSSDAESNTSWSEPILNPSRHMVHDSDSDDYSPVCSEVDDGEFPSTVDSLDGNSCYAENSPSDPYLDEDSRDTEDCSQGSKKHITTRLKESLLENIVRIIKSYIKLRPLHPHLAHVDLLIQLSKCAITYQFDVKNVICDIVACHEHLIPLMKSNFVEVLYDMRSFPLGHESCSKCLLHGHFTYTVLRSITETAESGAGRGDIAHILLKGDLETKQKLVAVIPYIIGNRSILGKLMIQCGGLRILMDLLRDNSEEDNRRSVKVICQMALKGLFIANPRRPNADKIIPTVVPMYILSETCENVVSFKLEDGKIVNADRDFLISKSDYFSGLLDGHFRERNENKIDLFDVKSRTFECMLYLLQNIADAVDVVIELDTLLDIILLCDRFLLVRLCTAISEIVEQYYITTETVPIIYNWSVATGTNLLRIECVAYALVANVDDRIRFTMFEKLFNLGYKEQLLDDIEKLLSRYLNQNVHSQRGRDFKVKGSHGKMKDRLLKNV